MIGVWPMDTEQQRTELAYLLANAPADGRYRVTITGTTMTTDNLFDPTAEEWHLLKAENAELKAKLADWERKSEELTAKVQALLQRLDEGDMPL